MALRASETKAKINFYVLLKTTDIEEGAGKSMSWCSESRE